MNAVVLTVFRIPVKFTWPVC